MLPPVGYVVETLPFLIQSLLGYTGIYVDMWRDLLGDELRLESRTFSGDFDAGPEGRFTGLLGEVQNLTSSGAIGQMFLTEDRMREFAYTPCFSYGKREIYEKREESAWIFNLDAFILFRPEIIILFLAAFAILGVAFLIVRKALLNLDSERTSLSSLFLRAIFQLGLLLLLVHYLGVFSGNSTNERKIFRTSMNTLVADLSSSKRTFIVNRPSNLLVTHKIELFREERPSYEKLQVISDPKTVLNKICNSQRFAYFDVDEFVDTYLQMKDLTAQCAFKSVDPSDLSKFAADSALRAEQFGREAPIVFYYSKRLFNRTRRERFAQIILRIYDFDKFSTVHWRRYTNRPRGEKRGSTWVTFNSTDLPQLYSVLIVIVGCYLFSISVFVVEMLGSKSVRAHRISIRAHKLLRTVSIASRDNL